MIVCLVCIYVWYVLRIVRFGVSQVRAGGNIECDVVAFVATMSHSCPAIESDVGIAMSDPLDPLDRSQSASFG